MADFPDFYADGIGVSVGPFGVTVTFQLSQPLLEPGPHAEISIVVGRVRMSPALSKALIQGLTDATAQQASIQPETKTRN